MEELFKLAANYDFSMVVAGYLLLQLEPTICIDPGHNDTGADAGAIGNDLREQYHTLDIALNLTTLLEYNGFAVILTRDGDFVRGPHQTVTILADPL